MDNHFFPQPPKDVPQEVTVVKKLDATLPVNRSKPPRQGRPMSKEGLAIIARLEKLEVMGTDVFDSRSRASVVDYLHRLREGRLKSYTGKWDRDFKFIRVPARQKVLVVRVK